MNSKASFVGIFDAVRNRIAQAVGTQGLARCDVVGARSHVEGTPHVENAGRIEIGDDCSIVSLPVQTHLVVHRGGTLRIGNRVSLSHGCGVACHSLVEIGDDTVFGAFTMVLDSDYHVAGAPLLRAEPMPVRIGRNVRVGANVTILRGSQIGDGASIAAGSVVSGEIEAGATVAGVPARDMTSLRVSQLPLEIPASIESRVCEVAKTSFRLPATPALSDGPQQIPRWDSLGTLSFLVALEEEFDISLTEDATFAGQQLSDLVSLVERALERQRLRASQAAPL